MPMGSRAMLSLADEQPELRGNPRFSVLLVARLITTWGERIVKLRNISATGAMIEGDRLPPTGTDILLRRGSLELFATIVWIEDKQAGLEFDEPLTRSELWMQVNAPHFPADADAEDSAGRLRIDRPIRPPA
jgi:hypothetical protein